MKITAMPLMAESALRGYLGPLLAQDAKVDLKPVVKGLSAKAWAAGKSGIKARLATATAGKLAADASLEDVTDLLDSLDDVAEEVAQSIEGKEIADPADPTATDDDGDMVTRLKSVLKAKGMSDEDVDAIVAALKPEVAPPAADADKDKPVGVTRAAMDAAIAAATKQAEASTIARLNAARAAEADCRQWVGEFAAQDTALATYQMALDSMGVDAKGISDVKALQLVLHAQPKPGERKQPVNPAMDAAVTSEFANEYPNHNRLKN